MCGPGQAASTSSSAQGGEKYQLACVLLLQLLIQGISLDTLSLPGQVLDVQDSQESRGSRLNPEEYDA